MNSRHGLAGRGKMHPLYRVLQGIKIRCYQPSATHYSYYGGRGIKVCAEWLDDPLTFVSWAEAHGYRKGLDLDRIDTDGDYSPANCRFVSPTENRRRKRNISTTIEDARTVRRALDAGASVKEAAARAGVTYMVAWHIANNPNIWREVAA